MKIKICNETFTKRFIPQKERWYIGNDLILTTWFRYKYMLEKYNINILEIKIKGKEFKYFIEIHHINGNKLHDSINNGVMVIAKTKKELHEKHKKLDCYIKFKIPKYKNEKIKSEYNKLINEHKIIEENYMKSNIIFQ